MVLGRPMLLANVKEQRESQLRSMSLDCARDVNRVAIPGTWPEGV